MRHLIIGNGEIGKSLEQIFKCDIHDQVPFAPQKYDIIHIAFPFSKKFKKAVKEYQKRYKPTYTVIHSTVPVGTSKKLGAIHSPVNGKHPDLSESIQTFTKLVGGKGAKDIVKEFEKYSVPAKAFDNSDDTEAAKLWILNIYGMNILIEKEIYHYCKKNNLNFDVVYTEMVQAYNKGYETMGMPEFKTYELKHYPGKIGGHCITQNMPHLNSWFAKILFYANKYLL